MLLAVTLTENLQTNSSREEKPNQAVFPYNEPDLDQPLPINILLQHTALTSGCDPRGGSTIFTLSHSHPNSHMGSLVLHTAYCMMSDSTSRSQRSERTPTSCGECRRRKQRVRRWPSKPSVFMVVKRPNSLFYVVLPPRPHR